MKLYFARSKKDLAEIDDKVTDWDAAVVMIAMAALVAAAGPDGFDEAELDAVMVGAAPAEVTRMVLQSLGSLVELAWPDFDWS